MYTMKDWERDGTFKAKLGEVVEDAVVREMRDCVPPLIYSHAKGLFQVGEPYGADILYRSMLYTTFKLTLDGWVFCGHCLPGRTEHRGACGSTEKAALLAEHPELERFLHQPTSQL